MNKRIRKKLKCRQGYRTYARYYDNCNWKWVNYGGTPGYFITSCDWLSNRIEAEHESEYIYATLVARERAA